MRRNEDPLFQAHTDTTPLIMVVMMMAMMVMVVLVMMMVMMMVHSFEGIVTSARYSTFQCCRITLFQIIQSYDDFPVGPA